MLRILCLVFTTFLVLENLKATDEAQEPVRFPPDIWREYLIPHVTHKDKLALRATNSFLKRMVSEVYDITGVINYPNVEPPIMGCAYDSVRMEEEHLTGNHDCKELLKQRLNPHSNWAPCCYFLALKKTIELNSTSKDMGSQILFLWPSRYCPGVDRAFLRAAAEKYNVPLASSLWEIPYTWSYGIQVAMGGTFKISFCLVEAMVSSLGMVIPIFNFVYQDRDGVCGVFYNLNEVGSLFRYVEQSLLGHGAIYIFPYMSYKPLISVGLSALNICFGMIRVYKVDPSRIPKKFEGIPFLASVRDVYLHHDANLPQIRSKFIQAAKLSVVVAGVWFARELYMAHMQELSTYKALQSVYGPVSDVQCCSVEDRLFRNCSIAALQSFLPYVANIVEPVMRERSTFNILVLYSPQLFVILRLIWHVLII